MKIKNKSDFYKSISFLFLFLFLTINYVDSAINPIALETSIYPNGEIYQIVYDQRTGVTYLGGNFTRVGGTSTGATALFNLQTGQVTPSFPKIYGTVYTIISDGNGGYYIGGDFNRVNNLEIRNLVHILPNFTVNQNFLPNPNGEVYALALYQNTLYIGGDFSSIFGQSRSNLASFDLSNNSLTSWSPNPDGPIFSLALPQSLINPPTSYVIETQLSVIRRLYVGGVFENISGAQRNSLAVFDLANGNLIDWQVPVIRSSFDYNWVNQFSGVIRDISVSDSAVYIGGYFNYIKDINGATGTRNYFAAFDINTGQLLPLNAGIEARADYMVYSIELTSSNIYIAGAFRKSGGGINLIAVDYSGNIQAGWRGFYQISGAIRDVKFLNNRLYLAGEFSSINDRNFDYFAILDLSSYNLSSLSTSPNNNVYEINIFGNNLLVGGKFNSIGALRRNGLAAVDSANRIMSWDPGLSIGTKFPGSVHLLYLTDQALYVGGIFTRINSERRDVSYLAAFDVRSGFPSSSLNWYPNPDDQVLSIYSDGMSLYVSGNFTQIFGQSKNKLAIFELNNGLPGNLKNWVTDNYFSPFDSVSSIVGSGNVLYLGGYFDLSGRKNLIAIDKNNGNLLDWNPSPDASVLKIIPHASKIYVLGLFSQISNQPRRSFAIFNESSLNLLPLNFNFNGEVLSFFPMGTIIYIGGNFTQVSSQPRNYVAGIDSSGNLLSWSPSFNGPVYSMALSTSSLYVGGNFSQVGTLPIYNLARFTLKIPPTITTSMNNFTLDVDTTTTTISIQTDKPANCRYSLDPNKDFSAMISSLTSDSSFRNHTLSLTNISYGTVNRYYLKCQDRTDSENKNFEDFVIRFSRGTVFKEIDRQGGTLSSIDNSNASINITQNILPSTSTFQIRPIILDLISNFNLPSLPSNRKYANLTYKNYQVLAYDITSNITSFSNPITISIKYDPSKVVENYVDIFKLSGNSWNPQNASCSNGVCNLQTRSLSIYAVLTKINPEGTGTGRGSGSGGGGGGGSQTQTQQPPSQQPPQQQNQQENQRQLLLYYLLNLLSSKATTTAVKTPTITTPTSKIIKPKPKKLNIPSYCKFNKVIQLGDTDSKVMKRYKKDNDKPVYCLQIFLRSQGFYKGKITGRFDQATRKAVMNFQEKYKKDILIPQKLKKPTGKVAGSTLKKIREIIRSSR